MRIVEGLWLDIAESPRDDTPWLVMADYHEEHGDPDRAELLRLAIRLRNGFDHPPPEAESRYRELVAAGIRLPLPTRRVALNPVADMDFVLVPPGRFLMGSPESEPRRDSDEGPTHPVLISRAFWMAVHPVTQLQWRAVMGSRAPGRFRGPDRPVEGLSWFDCNDYLGHFARVAGVPAQLPTEAQWEYACRALTTTPFFHGEQLTSRQANFDGNYGYGSSEPGPWLEQTTRVGQYPPNAFGLSDMHGNVWEWCADWYDEAYYARSPEADPPGPDTGALRVLRGGSWYSYSWSCRSAGRERFAPESGAGNYGFRLVMEFA